MKRKPFREDGGCNWDVPAIYSEKYEAYIRPGTSDEKVWQEIREYKAMKISSRDRVLDLGGNIGAFSSKAVCFGAVVLAYEPEPENYKLLKLNSPDSENIQAAVVSGKERRVTLYLNRGTGAGSHTVEPTRGRIPIQVPAVQFSEVLREFKPTKIKCDIEGAEFDLFINTKLPKCVTEVIMELHLKGRDKWLRATVALHKSFLQQGFEAIVSPRFKKTDWHCPAHYRR